MSSVRSATAWCRRRWHQSLVLSVTLMGVAAVTARLGVVLGGARVGFLAGLMVAANLGMFLDGRLV